MKRVCEYELFFLVLFFCLIFKVSAVCDNNTRIELSSAASNVTMNYTIEQLVVDSLDRVHPEIDPKDVELSETSKYRFYDRVTLNVNNISDKIWVVLTSDDNDINKEYHYSDLSDGSISYKVPDTEIIRHYTLTIYSEAYGCENEELRQIQVATPMYNPMADEGVCDGNNANYCNTYVTSEVSISEDEYNRLLDEYINRNENIENNNVDDKKKEEENNNRKNINIMLVGVCIVLVLAIIIVIVRRRKKMKDLRGF